MSTNSVTTGDTTHDQLERRDAIHRRSDKEILKKMLTKRIFDSRDLHHGKVHTYAYHCFRSRSFTGTFLYCPFCVNAGPYDAL